jgi:hypothetical protein
MTIWKATLLVAAIAAFAPASTAAFAASNPFLPGGSGGSKMGQGTAQEQAACRPDVRRFCSSVKSGSDSEAYLHCLQANRAKLSKACANVLSSHGV